MSGFGAAAETAGDLGAELDLDRCLVELERLGIGVRGDEFDAAEAGPTIVLSALPPPPPTPITLIDGLQLASLLELQQSSESSSGPIFQELRLADLLLVPARSPFLTVFADLARDERPFEHRSPPEIATPGPSHRQ